MTDPIYTLTWQIRALRLVEGRHVVLVIQGQDFTQGLTDPSSDGGLLGKQKGGSQPMLPAKGCPLLPRASSTEVHSAGWRVGTEEEWPLSLDL